MTIIILFFFTLYLEKTLFFHVGIYLYLLMPNQSSIFIPTKRKFITLGALFSNRIVH